MNNNILSQKGITQAEKEVLEILVKGLTNELISERMSISVSTVKKHLESIYRKLEVHNRLQAIYVAYFSEDAL